jgi:hypothetical protein
MSSIAIVTNLSFDIKGRDYGSEDRLLAVELRNRGFKVDLVHPEEVLPINDGASANDELLSRTDALIYRNCYGGSLEAEYRTVLAKFLASHQQVKIFNQLTGCRGDYCGKQHLLDLYSAGFPVIPSTTSVTDLEVAPFKASYAFVVKSMTGADSNGIKRDLTADQVRAEFVQIPENQQSDGHFLIQPMVDFSYEVSFYFFENEFMYAVYNGEDALAAAGTGDSSLSRIGEGSQDDDESTKRWTLNVYDPSPEDLAFARKFVDWNDCKRQIQRIDACRLRTPYCTSASTSTSTSTSTSISGTGTINTIETGQLLLMEVEDYNCWLSLGDLAQQRPQLLSGFVDRLALSLQDFIEQQT